MLSASISSRGHSGNLQRLSRVKGEHLVDLPTYTSIWRIEKRLYKLYDFRLPMPLPIGQVTVFVAIAVPYVVLLTMLGLPSNHTLIWLYILPPGLATCLVWRPRAGRPTVAAAAAAQAEFGPAQPPGEAAEAPAWTRATDDVPARPGRRRLGPPRRHASPRGHARRSESDGPSPPVQRR